MGDGRGAQSLHNYSPPDADRNRIGFVSTRLAGSDGVSLEVAKWVDALTELGYECYFFAGESDWPEERTLLVPEAHFSHPRIAELNRILFETNERTAATSREVATIKEYLKEHIYRFQREFNIDVMIVENALALPMNVPLGLALTEYIAESDFPVIAHHHDFAWERDRYSVTDADDYLRVAFPPVLRSIQHVIINSYASRQLAQRTGVRSTMIPNVMDFETPPPARDAYAADFRKTLGIAPDAYLLLQPTRIVPRKRIEQAIYLAKRVDERAVLLITHASGDEGKEYETYLRGYAEALGVHTIFAADRVQPERALNASGDKIYSLADAYHHADLVTYPSRVEGFGNAFLEAVYYSRPLVMSTYEIFKTDIQPKGFNVVAFDEFITEETVIHARRLLEDHAHVREITAHNYELGRRHYSYRNLTDHLIPLINAVWHASNGNGTE